MIAPTGAEVDGRPYGVRGIVGGAAGGSGWRAIGDRPYGVRRGIGWVVFGVVCGVVFGVVFGVISGAFRG